MGKSKATSTFNEKIVGLIYVLILFLVTTGICAHILFEQDMNNQFDNSKRDAMDKMERVSSFRNIQSEYFDRLTIIDDRLNSINPNVQANQLKGDLYYNVGVLKKVQNDNKYDLRFKIFGQLARFYEVKLTDKECLFASIKNIDLFKTELEECRSGVESYKNK